MLSPMLKYPLVAGIVTLKMKVATNTKAENTATFMICLCLSILGQTCPADGVSMKAPLWGLFLTEPLIVLREPNEDGQVKVLDVKDLKPGMSRVHLAVKVLKALESIQTVTSGGVEHQILELEVGDKSGSIRLVLWDEKIVSDLKEGDAVKIENGFVTSFKGV